MSQKSVEKTLNLDFVPPLWLRPAMVQTAVASLKFRKKGHNPVTARAEQLVLDCGDGVRLLASYSRHDEPKGSVVFLHGWEGSEESTYVLSCARHMYRAGYSVFRLNFRDHGDSHALNEAAFHSARLDEVFNGVVNCAKLADSLPAYLVGFSLGGNFALRIIRELQTRPVIALQHVFAISPVINPMAASPTVDENYFIKRYFRKKWRASLSKKQAAFPEKYDFSDLYEYKNVMDFTRAFLPTYTEFATMEEYFDAYRIWQNDLADVRTPTSIIMAVDDPVVPHDDLLDLDLSSCIDLIMLKYGGHNGFFQSLRGPTWYDNYILNRIEGQGE